MQKHDDAVVADRSPEPAQPAPHRRKISFLLFNLYGIGGTIRSTVNLSGALAEAGHDVEIVSMIRTRDTPALPVHPRVRVVPLVETRRSHPRFDPAHDPQDNPSLVYPSCDGPYKLCSALVDARIEAYLRDTDADVVIGTRPGINVYLARYGSAPTLLVGQEHLTHDMHKTDLRAVQNEAVARLDAFVTVSRQDARIYRAALPGVTTEIRCIPNAVPRPNVAPSSGRNKLVVAAGRLIRVKNYRLLIDAFARVVEQRPDWTLRLYGRGPEARALRARIQELGLCEHVVMMGAHAPIEPEWAKGSIAAVSSDAESFGMTIVEAMHAGLPVVATDCPFGPGEIISDGVDGLLVRVGDVEDLAAGLLSLIEQDERRAAMATAARDKALAYAPSVVADAYGRLFDELAARTGKGTVRPAPPAGPAGRAEPTRRTPGRRLGTALARHAAHPLLRRTATTAPVLGLLRAVAPGLAGRADGTARRLRPEAHCRVADDGSLDLAFSRKGLPGPRYALVLRHRKSAEELRLPLPVPARARAADARIPLRLARLPLAEGHWDVYALRHADGARRPVRVTMIETAGLVGRMPDVADGTVWSWIPYATEEGHLALRAWRRAAHAEAVSIAVGPSGTQVEAELLGAEPAAGAVVEALRRGERPTALQLPVTDLGAGRFSCLLPHDEFTGRVSGPTPQDREFWDLCLMLPGRPGVRIGRIGGDVVDRKAVDVHPSAFRGEGADRVRVRPYFTQGNNLALVAAPAPAPSTAPVHVAAPRCEHSHTG